MLEKKSRRRSEHYAAVYDAVIKHLENFSIEFDCDIFTNSVTEEFLDDFIVYLEDRGLRHNTIVGYIQKIQSLVRKASQYNYAVDSTYDEIDLKEEQNTGVFFTVGWKDCHKGYFVGLYYGDGQWESDHRIFLPDSSLGCITHWMPIPKFD